MSPNCRLELRANRLKLGRMSKNGRIFVSQSVSFPPELLAAAKKRARSLGLGFSTYVRKCLERDLIERKALIFEEMPEVERMVADDPPRKRGRDASTRRP